MFVSPEAVEEYGEDFGQHPVGTSAYKFVNWDRGQQVVLERYEDYWGGEAAIKDVVYRPIIEEMSKLAALLTGEAHLAYSNSPATIQKLQEEEDTTVFGMPTGAVWFLSMNTQREPFTDIRVRRAIAHAINKEAIVHNTLQDTVDIAHGPLGPAYQCSNPDVTVYEYDPEKAKQLMAEAGYPDGFEVTFEVPQSGSGMQLPVEMATAIQADLAAIGITAKIEITDFVTWMGRIRTEEVELAVMSWNPPPTVETHTLLNVFTDQGLPPNGFNTAWYINPEVKELLEQATVTIDDTERCNLLLRAQQMIVDDVPVVFVDHDTQYYAIDDRLEGFNPSLGSHAYLWSVRWKE